MAYIDTNELFKCETCRHCKGEIKCDTFCDTGEQYIPDMSKIPAADVAEVVRCKDCIHRSVPTRCSLWMGTSGDTNYFREHGDDFFCAFGTPKERR